jgi:phospholipid:diacylglycerol acyltransferase
MSFLRRRFGGSTNDAPADTPEPEHAPGEPRPANLRVVTAEHLDTLKTKGKGKRKNAWVFGLGGLFGLVVAGFFASSNEMIDLKSLENMNLDSILDALPASFVSSAQQLQVSTALLAPRCTAGLSADAVGSVEKRTRCSQLRLLHRGPACP